MSERITFMRIWCFILFFSYCSFLLILDANVTWKFGKFKSPPSHQMKLFRYSMSGADGINKNHKAFVVLTFVVVSVMISAD